MRTVFILFLVILASGVRTMCEERRIDSVEIAYEDYYTLKRTDYLDPIEMFDIRHSRFVTFITVKDSLSMHILANAPLSSTDFSGPCIAGSRIAVRTYYSDGKEDVYGIVDLFVWHRNKCGKASLQTLAAVFAFLPKDYILSIAHL